MSESGGWHWHPSAAFDALCLLPLLADIPFYVSRHADDARQWQERLRAAGDRYVTEGLGRLRRRVSDEVGKPMPAFLALWVSPAIGPDDGPDLDHVISMLSDGDARPEMMRQRSAHWNAGGDALFREIQPALETALRGLLDLGYASWWESNARPGLLVRCGELARELAGADVIRLVRAHTGLELESDRVEVCVLRWAAPHAIRVTGVRFLADVRYDSSITLANAIHELLHPPWPAGHPAKDLLDGLAHDPFLAGKFAARDPAAGYNSWAAYAEEDAAQALDQYLVEKLGCARADAKTRWTTADGGMHTLAWLIYDALTEQGFEPGNERYADFLQRALSDGAGWPADSGRDYQRLIGAGDQAAYGVDGCSGAAGSH